MSQSAHGAQTQAGYSFSGGTFTVAQTGTGTVFLSGTLDPFDLIAQRSGKTASAITAASVHSSLDAVFEDATLLPALAAYYNIQPTASGDLTMDVNRLGLGTTLLPDSPQTLLAATLSPPVTPNISAAYVDMSVPAVPIPPTLMLLAPGLLGLVGMRKRLRAAGITRV